LKKRLIKYSLWCFGTLLFLHGLGWCYYAATPNPLVEKRTTAAAKADSSTLLIVGNSRAWHGINDTLWNGAINTSNLGENSIYTYYQIKYWLENETKPAAILYPCATTDIYSLSSHYNNRDYAWREHINYTEIGWHKDATFQDMAFHAKRKFFPYALLINWQLESPTQELQPENKGHYARLSDEERTQHASNMVAAYPNKLHFQSEAAILYLQKTIDLCAKHNVQLIGVKFPTTLEYRNAVALHLKEQGLSARSDSVLTSNNILTLDTEHYFEDMPQFFLDPHHLNPSGRDRYTPLLKKQVERHTRQRK